MGECEIRQAPSWAARPAGSIEQYRDGSRCGGGRVGGGGG